MAQLLPPERRREIRRETIGSLWLVDSHAGTAIRCACIDRSDHGMRLRAPLGYGICSGQQYELCSHPPGQFPAPSLGLALRRGVAVVRADISLEDESDQLDVGVLFDGSREARVTPAAPRQAAAALV
jgi:hypothetical protein